MRISEEQITDAVAQLRDIIARGPEGSAYWHSYFLNLRYGYHLDPVVPAFGWGDDGQIGPYALQVGGGDSRFTSERDRTLAHEHARQLLKVAAERIAVEDGDDEVWQVVHLSD